MRDLLVGLAYFIPTALAVCFMLWFFCNLCWQSLSRQTRRRLLLHRDSPARLQTFEIASPKPLLRIPSHG